MKMKKFLIHLASITSTRSHSLPGTAFAGVGCGNGDITPFSNFNVPVDLKVASSGTTRLPIVTGGFAGTVAAGGAATGVIFGLSVGHCEIFVGAGPAPPGMGSAPGNGIGAGFVSGGGSGNFISAGLSSGS